MTVGGWIMIIFSWGVILGLTLFCYARFFRVRRMNIQAPLEIDTEPD